MKSFTKSRAAAFGMAGALALGTVASVGVIAPATAASSQYTCQLSTGPTPLDIVGSMDLPSSVAPGGSLTALPTTLGVTLPGSLTTVLVQLLGLTNVAGSVTGAEFPIGDTGKSITSGKLTEPGQALTAGSAATLLGKGSSSGTAPSKTGSYDVMMPKSFTFVPTGDLPPIPCTTAAPVSLGTLLVSGSSEKAASKTTATLKNGPITKGEHAKILAKVRSAGAAAAGKVIAKEGSKVLKKATLSGGKATLKLPVLSKGTHKIVIKYKGNATTAASKDVVKFSAKG